MKAAVFIALKDLRLLCRDRVALFWVVGFPVLFSMFFGAVLEAALDDEPSSRPVLLVDEARNQASRAFVQRVEQPGTVRLTSASLDEAVAAVRRADALAYLRIFPSFEERSHASIELGVDPTRRSDSAVIEGAVVEALGVPRAVRPTGPVRRVVVHAPKRDPRTAFDLVFPAAILWGLMGCAATFAVSVVTERARGTLVRLRVAPVARASLLGGKALACFTASVIDALVLLVVFRLALGVSVDSWDKTLVAMGATALCFVGLTMALSVLGRSEQSVAGAGWATLIVLAMLGGAMVPLSIMPSWLRSLSDISPVKWGIVALEGAAWRGFSWQELVEPLSILVATGLACFALGLLLLRRVER